MHLLRVGLDRVALALLAEELALEPFDLRAQRLDLVAQNVVGCGLRSQQLHDLLRVQRGHFGGVGNAAERGAGHGFSCCAAPRRHTMGLFRIAMSASAG